MKKDESPPLVSGLEFPLQFTWTHLDNRGASLGGSIREITGEKILQKETSRLLTRWEARSRRGQTAHRSGQRFLALGIQHWRLPQAPQIVDQTVHDLRNGKIGCGRGYSVHLETPRAEGLRHEAR